MIIISENKYKNDLIDYHKHILFTDKYNIPNLLEEVINNYEYYYKKLDLDNIDIHLNNEHIKTIKSILEK